MKNITLLTSIILLLTLYSCNKTKSPVTTPPFASGSHTSQQVKQILIGHSWGSYFETEIDTLGVRTNQWMSYSNTWFQEVLIFHTDSMTFVGENKPYQWDVYANGDSIKFTRSPTYPIYPLDDQWGLDSVTTNSFTLTQSKYYQSTGELASTYYLSFKKIP